VGPCTASGARVKNSPNQAVEQWDDKDSHVEELIALTSDYRVAHAAFEEAVKQRLCRVVILE